MTSSSTLHASLRRHIIERHVLETTLGHQPDERINDLRPPFHRLARTADPDRTSGTRQFAWRISTGHTVIEARHRRSRRCPTDTRELLPNGRPTPADVIPGHSAWAAVRRKLVRPGRVTGRALSSAPDRHFGDAPSSSFVAERCQHSPDSGGRRIPKCPDRRLPGRLNGIRPRPVRLPGQVLGHASG